MINNITRNSANGKLFYHMQKDELLEVIEAIQQLTKSFNANSASTGSWERQRNDELWEALRNANFNLNRLT